MCFAGFAWTRVGPRRLVALGFGEAVFVVRGGDCGPRTAAIKGDGSMGGVGVGGLAREGRRLSEKRGEGWLGW